MNQEYVNSFPFDPTEFPFNIEVSGITDYDNKHVISRENSHCYIIEYVCEGSGTLIYNNVKHHLKKGDVYILAKGSNHEYYADEKWKKIWFNIDGILVTSLIYSYGLENNVVFHRFDDPAPFEELYNTTTLNLPVTEIMLAASMQFHTIIQKLYTFNKKSLYDDKINAIKQMLDASIYKKDVSIIGIAEKLAISQTQVINLFKNAFDITPYQYFQKKRIKLAAELLLNSNKTVREIALMLNYTDQPYFSKLFKKYIGISPEAYRNSGAKKITEKSNINNKRMPENDEQLPFELKINRH